MTAAPGNPLEKAKQGNPQALAALIGRSMKSQGIDVDVTRDEGTIHVWLEADKVPNPQAAVSFIRKGMSNLGIRNVDTVKVYGKPRDADTPLWQEEFALAPPAPPRSQAPRTPPPPEVPPTADLPPDEPLVAEDSLPDDLLEDSDFPEELVDDDPIPLPGETLPMAIEDDDMDVESEGFEEDEDGVEEAPPEKKSKALSPVLLGLLVLVALGAVGFFLWPQIQAYLPPIPLLGGGESEEDPETIPEATGEAPAAAPPAEGTPAATGEAPAAAPPAEGTPEATGEAPAAQETPATPAPETAEPPEATTPEATPSPDPFRDAVQSATQAAELTQTAQTPEEWQEVADLWQQAIDSMQAVPEGHQGYDIAQQKVGEYQRNLEYAQQAGQL